MSAICFPRGVDVKQTIQWDSRKCKRVYQRHTTSKSARLGTGDVTEKGENPQSEPRADNHAKSTQKMNPRLSWSGTSADSLDDPASSWTTIKQRVISSECSIHSALLTNYRRLLSQAAPEDHVHCVECCGRQHAPTAAPPLTPG